MPELIPAAPGSPEWLAARRQGVTATDIVTILGLSSTNSAYSLFWQKMGQVPEPADNDRFRLGRELERYVIMRWLEEHPDLMPSGAGKTWRHSERHWQMATPDRHVFAKATINDMTVPAAGVLEVKTWADADRHSWGRGQVFDDDGTLLVHDDQIPATVRAQVLWQMDVMDVAAGHVGVVFLPSGEFRSYTLAHPLAAEHDTATGIEWAISGDSSLLCSVCQDIGLMRAAGEEFMARLRLELPAPDPDASAATLAAVKARFARQPDKTAEVDPKLIEGWVVSKEIVANDELFVRKFESLLREQAGEASVLTVDGQPVARRITGEAQVKAHTRHSDYLKRIKTEADDA